MHLDGDVLAVEQFYRVYSVYKQEKFGGQNFWQLLTNPPKYSPPKYDISYCSCHDNNKVSVDLEETAGVTAIIMITCCTYSSV